MKLFLRSGIAKDDPEKLLTPAIQYVNAKDDEHQCHLFQFGWWHYWVGFALVTKNPKP